jgi:hypothetical protein
MPFHQKGTQQWGQPMPQYPPTAIQGSTLTTGYCLLLLVWMPDNLYFKACSMRTLLRVLNVAPSWLIEQKGYKMMRANVGSFDGANCGVLACLWCLWFMLYRRIWIWQPFDFYSVVSQYLHGCLHNINLKSWFLKCLGFSELWVVTMHSKPGDMHCALSSTTFNVFSCHSGTISGF